MVSNDLLELVIVCKLLCWALSVGLFVSSWVVLRILYSGVWILWFIVVRNVDFVWLVFFVFVCVCWCFIISFCNLVVCVLICVVSCLWWWFSVWILLWNVFISCLMVFSFCMLVVFGKGELILLFSSCCSVCVCLVSGCVIEW